MSSMLAHETNAADLKQMIVDEQSKYMADQKVSKTQLDYIDERVRTQFQNVVSEVSDLKSQLTYLNAWAQRLANEHARHSKPFTAIPGKSALWHQRSDGTSQDFEK
eukprot:5521110-Pyramimonas_sp.AAC.1